jgi:hypothetical protein
MADPDPELVEKVAAPVLAIIAREVYCGQAPEAPADHPCKATWLPYKRRCPECPLHHTQRADLAAEIARAAIAVCFEARVPEAERVLDRFNELRRTTGASDVICMRQALGSK